MSEQKPGSPFDEVVFASRGKIAEGAPPFVRFVSGRRDQLADVRAKASLLRDLAKPAVKATDALAATLNIMETASGRMDRRVQRTKVNAGTMATAIEQLSWEQANGRGGFLARPDLASDTAVVRAMENMADDIANKVHDEMQPSILEAEKRASAKLRAFATSIDEARAHAREPAALRDKGASLADVLNLERLRVELEARGPAYVRQQWEAARNFDDKTKMMRIEEAARPYLAATLRESPAALEARAKKTYFGETRAGELSDFVAVVRGLLFAFDQAEASRMPPQIPAAEAVLEMLETTFRELLGFDSHLLSPEEFSRRYLNGGVMTTLAQERFTPQEGWATRWARPRNFPMLLRAVGLGAEVKRAGGL